MINMKTMEIFVQSIILTIVLTFVGVVTASQSYLLIFVAGILMVLFTIRSLSDIPNKYVCFVQVAVSILFVFLSEGMLSSLVFYEYRGKKAMQMLLPPIMYFVVQMLTGNQEMPNILFYMIVLFLLGFGLAVIENLIQKYILAQEQIAQNATISAVGELYEKKLNQELVMKNYLADRSARLEERENISRNIHNSVGHSITAAIMTLDAADLLFDSDKDKAREKMNMANERIRASLDSIRQAVRVLDSESKYIAISDFIGELTAVTESFSMDTAIKILTDFSNIYEELFLPHEHTEFLTGALQELLTNGVRHGKADKYVVHLTSDSRHVKLSVCDNGKSNFSAENAERKIRNGFGLKKLISYTEKCGGTTAFENQNGFRATITLPLLKEEENE